MLNTITLVAALSILIAASAPAASAATAAPESYWVYIGTFTFGDGQGIYASKLDLKAGTLSEPRLAADAVDPNYLTIHPKLPVLYAVAGSKPPEKRQSGEVMAWTINPATGALSPLNQMATGGREAVYIAVNPQATLAVAAHYSSASVVALPLSSTGELRPVSSQAQQQGSSINPKRQQHSFPHSITFDPAGRFAFSPDLGADKIFMYRTDDGQLAPNDPPSVTIAPGSGPRHLVFDAAGTHAYLVNELNSTISAFHYDSNRGALTLAQTISTLPADFQGSNTGADIRLHPSGKFLYASNRGHESLAIFAVDAADGKLTAIGYVPVHVKMPRGFAIDPTGQYLIAAGQQSDSLALFAIDIATGNLTFREIIKAPKPVCVTFFPTGNEATPYNR